MNPSFHIFQVISSCSVKYINERSKTLSLSETLPCQYSRIFSMSCTSVSIKRYKKPLWQDLRSCFTDELNKEVKFTLRGNAVIKGNSRVFEVYRKEVTIKSFASRIFWSWVINLRKYSSIKRFICASSLLFMAIIVWLHFSFQILYNKPSNVSVLYQRG